MALIKVNAFTTPLKSDFVYSNPAAGGVTVSDTELAVWIGSILDGAEVPYQEAHGAVEVALNAIRDSGLQAGGAGVYINAEVIFGGLPGKRDHRSNVTVTQGVASIPPPTNGVVIIVGGLFRQTPSSSITPFVRRAFEVYLEQHAKKNVA